MPPVTRFRASEGHLLVCGDDKLAHQVARELTTRYRERVTVILPSKRLEAALHARAIRADLRIVLRLYDDDLAERVQKMIGNTVSRSVSYLAAPAFAAAMLEHQVLRTIPVGRHVLLIADVRVEAGAELAGKPVAEAERRGETH